VTDGVGHVEADVALVEPHHVVQVAADVTGGAVERVEVHVADLREVFREEVLLEARREAQLFIQPVHVKLQRFVATAQDVHLGAEAVDFFLGFVEVAFERDDAGERVRRARFVDVFGGARAGRNRHVGDQAE
jgi:hypothetical protein